MRATPTATVEEAPAPAPPVQSAVPDALPLTEQQQAVLEALCAFVAGPERAFVLTGSAGTGKTTLLRAACAAFEQQDRTVQLLAPTGRAAQVLRRRTGYPTRTVHSFLYVPEPLQDRPGVRMVRKGLFAEQADVIIVDEASLLPRHRTRSEHFVMAASLLDDLIDTARRSEAHLVFVGDPNQLPPVGETTAAALQPALLAEAYGLPTGGAHLDEVLRQAAGSPVLQAAMALRDALGGGPCRLPTLPQCRTRRSAVEHYLSAVAEERYDRATMLAYTNRSVCELNRRVRARLGLRERLVPGDLVVTDRDGWADGRLVPRAESYLVTEVRPAPPLAGLHFARVHLRPVAEDGHGVEGLALLDTLAGERGQIGHEKEMALFAAACKHNTAYRRTGRASDDAYAGALRLRYGHALTVHKAQGGEWPQVYVEPYVSPMVEWATALRWRYTALTRAVDEAIVVGPSTL